MSVNQREILSNIKNFSQLLDYLRDEMNWPIGESDFEDITFDYQPEELGIDEKNAAKIISIKRLRPLSVNQPWGIFFIEFEPKKLPVVALRRILSKVTIKKRASSNSVERAAWEVSDLLFISNYGDDYQRTISFAHFSQKDKTRLPVLKVLGWNDEDTALHLDAISTQLISKLSWPKTENTTLWRENWRSAFLTEYREVIKNSKELSIQLAKHAKLIRNRIYKALSIESEEGALTKLLKTFQKILLHDLDEEGFSDMYAQTIVYGLLSTRIINSTKQAEMDSAQIPLTNPFLKELMETFLKVGEKNGTDNNLDYDELGLYDVIELLDTVNMDVIIRDFGDKNPQEDPVIHFYELFINEYDSKKRVERGVFYTPRPVVSYIVRSVDHMLKEQFNLQDGLADTSTWADVAKSNKDIQIPKKEVANSPFVQILDPATGTGTFLVEVIDVVYQTMKLKWESLGHTETEICELWNQYVPNNLLPRLYGYEIMMAPYTIAHLKIGLKLFETGYDFKDDQRVRVFLTNSLEPSTNTGQKSLTNLAKAIAREAQAVNTVKENIFFTVVIGNPPYSDSVTENHWIMKKIDAFKEGLNEQKSDLNREEWKFIRVVKEFSGGDSPHICCYIINNAFLRAITHRLMRKYLVNEYSKIAILNLHGSSRPPEYVPKKVQAELNIGPKDQNVFDIMQGVTIVLLIKNNLDKKISYRELWGTTNRKLKQLSMISLLDPSINLIKPKTPYFFLYDIKGELYEEYDSWPRINDIFLINTSGIQTGRDAFVSTITKDEMDDRIKSIIKKEDWEKIAPNVKKPIWSGFSLKKLRKEKKLNEFVIKWLYNPFDVRYLLYHKDAIKRTRKPKMDKMLKNQLGICTVRQIYSGTWQHAFISENPISDTCVSNKSREYPYIFTGDISDSNSGLSKLARNYSNEILESKQNNILNNIIAYTYSILYSSIYRKKYLEQLMIDFPKIPLFSNKKLAQEIKNKGYELISLHLLKSDKLNELNTLAIGDWSNKIEKVFWSNGTIWIDKAKKTGINEVSKDVWDFNIGGYQVCNRWLKSRRNRILDEDELIKYQKILNSISKTITIMKEIDELILEYDDSEVFLSTYNYEKTQISMLDFNA